MGTYDTPKLKNIDRMMVAQATTLAPPVSIPGAPDVPLVPEAPIGPAAALAAGGAAAAGLGIAVGGGLNAQQRLTEGMDAATPGDTTPTWTGALDLSAPAPPTIEQIEKAYAKSQAQALATAKVKPNSWVRITSNPCVIFACPAAPLPSYQYKGGTYACVKGSGNEGHHTPAASVSYLPPSAGPAVQMDPTDYTLTGSYGSKATSAFYRTAQGGLIANGNFMGAVGMDVADLSQSKFHHKYDGAVAQMLLYANCLKTYGFVR